MGCEYMEGSREIWGKRKGHLIIYLRNKVSNAQDASAYSLSLSLFLVDTDCSAFNVNDSWETNTLINGFSKLPMNVSNASHKDNIE